MLQKQKKKDFSRKEELSVVIKCYWEIAEDEEAMIGFGDVVVIGDCHMINCNEVLGAKA